jgi:cytochrome b subunit of formate dehydrogenase
VSPKAKQRIKRFTPVQQLFHVLLMVSFLIQSATGLARMYIETTWGRQLAYLFGGYEAARTIHIYVGILMLVGFLIHIVYLLAKINLQRLSADLSGPDSLLPRSVDIRHFFQHICWLVGLQKQPDFDRWGYWEKFDYWAVFWGMVVIGITGLMLAFPLATSRSFPGWTLNVAFWVHRIEALLAIGHVFIIHFFIGHLRKMNFPMDRAMFEGSADFAHTRHERPAWIRRLEKANLLDGMLTTEAASGRRMVSYLFGYIGLAAGIYLLVGALANARLITW